MTMPPIKSGDDSGKSTLKRDKDKDKDKDKEKDKDKDSASGSLSKCIESISQLLTKK